MQDTARLFLCVFRCWAGVFSPDTPFKMLEPSVSCTWGAGGKTGQAIGFSPVLSLLLAAWLAAPFVVCLLSPLMFPSKELNWVEGGGDDSPSFSPHDLGGPWNFGGGITLHPCGSGGLGKTTTNTPPSLALPHSDHHEAELQPRSHCFSTPPRLLLWKASDHPLIFPILFFEMTVFFSPPWIIFMCWPPYYWTGSAWFPCSCFHLPAPYFIVH